VLHTYRIDDVGKADYRFAWEDGMIAGSLAAGQGFSNPFKLFTGPTAWVAPLYPYLMAGTFRLFGSFTNASALVLLLFDSLCSALTCIPVYWIARKCFGDKVAFWSTWTWALFPYAMYFAVTLIWDTCLTTLLLSLAFLLTLKLEESATRGDWLLFGFLWSTIALCYPTCLSFLLVAGLWLWYRRHQKGQPSLGGLVLSGVVCCLLVTPWLVRNYQVFGRPVFIRTNFGAELRMGNGINADGRWMVYLHPSQNPGEMHKYMSMGEVAYTASRQAEAMNFIRQNPGRFVVLTLKRIVYFWAGIRRVGNPVLDELRNALFLAESILGLWGMFHALRQRRLGWFLFASLLLVYPLVYYFVFAIPRFRQPMDPLLIILAVYLISEAEGVSFRSRKLQKLAATT
jgi:4-amino-4-deoxy-L-arabinose transferase-like glycosyltransferase